ncbi:patatin-like phospholipase family protein [Hyphomicrobium sp.]|uniref:patatin-like phospholipase family protein n=1 Tax=Hyphomicrobium sp. TaxID=82 RepID=UPI000F9EC8F2|nr:patatin-like phospholipase family protein [Hyphomicrobium sp.]RUP00514.1 MAG: patatin-like phospholipase family protein [Hyphomicrobium sp.]
MAQSNGTSGEKKVLVLQGGGALGAYQGGAYEALAAQGLEPEWVAGISIGAINSALIAGNPPERRVKRLREFWDRVSSHLLLPPLATDNASRKLFNETSAALVASTGAPGFFDPRYPPALLMPPGTPQAISIYDTTPLKATLLELVDFDLLNSGKTRFSVGAVEVVTGNQVYFDSATETITPEHIMASGALPPGFPPVEIDGKLYWDGGIVSNTPLQYVLDGSIPRTDMCIFQLDLFSARGKMPENLFDVHTREKEIRYSSRTRMGTDYSQLIQSLRRAVRRLDGVLPDDIKSTSDWELLSTHSCNAAITVVHLIHRRAVYSTQSNDYEFSRYTVNEHWRAGIDDVEHTLSHPSWINRQKPDDGLMVLDLTKELSPSSPETNS